MRLEVSWMCSRMVFMPLMVRRTRSPPSWAMPTDFSATSAEAAVFDDTSSMECAICMTVALAFSICRA